LAKSRNFRSPILKIKGRWRAGIPQHLAIFENLLLKLGAPPGYTLGLDTRRYDAIPLNKRTCRLIFTLSFTIFCKKNQ